MQGANGYGLIRAERAFPGDSGVHAEMYSRRDLRMSYHVGNRMPLRVSNRAKTANLTTAVSSRRPPPLSLSSTVWIYSTTSRAHGAPTTPHRCQGAHLGFSMQ